MKRYSGWVSSSKNRLVTNDAIFDLLVFISAAPGAHILMVCFLSALAILKSTRYNIYKSRAASTPHRRAGERESERAQRLHNNFPTTYTDTHTYTIQCANDLHSLRYFCIRQMRMVFQCHRAVASKMQVCALLVRWVRSQQTECKNCTISNVFQPTNISSKKKNIFILCVDLFS